MTSFAKLPTELKEQIIATLHPTDLGHLSCTCKILYSAVLPLIYRSIAFTYTLDEPPSPATGKLLRSLLENGSLAPMIQQLHVRTRKSDSDAPSSYPYEALRLRQNCEAPVMSKLIDKAFKKLGLEDEERWRAQMAHRPLDTILALILLHCTNLKWLQIDSGLLSQNKAVFLALQRMALYQRSNPDNSMAQWTSLRRVDVLAPREEWYHPSESHLDMGFYLVFLHLETIEEVLFSNLAPNVTFDQSQKPTRYIAQSWEEMPVAMELPMVYLLTTLRLLSTLMEPGQLGNILSRTPSLEHLEYDYHVFGSTSHRIGSGPNGCYKCSDMDAALYCISGTLKTLILSGKLFFNNEGEVIRYKWIDGSMSSLRSLSRLRKLVLPFPLVYNKDESLRLGLFPTGLENLVLTDDYYLDAGLDWKVGEGLKLIEEDFKAGNHNPPRLKQFRLRMAETDD
ncbi:hypothetical protein P154DRAFT_536866 [Amniculicola lignicola CBS 123094]|uniref:F-box domain-containing protein n=1 Tax=Amniculicola lignicola CBS 123094 TaxID=1392246 RepID=A0A6A5WAK7_9PLEO|nr:hypothetical protein P154DRAFT_536866 [Amniculicola lignicola CBS 123094]